MWFSSFLAKRRAGLALDEFFEHNKTAFAAPFVEAKKFDLEYGAAVVVRTSREETDEPDKRRKTSTQGPKAPPPPTGLTVTNYGGGMNLSWNAVSGVTAYYVYRNGTLVGSTSGGALTFYDGGLAANTSYTYTVASNLGGTSGPSSTAPAKTYIGMPDYYLGLYNGSNHAANVGYTEEFQAYKGGVLFSAYQGKVLGGYSGAYQMASISVTGSSPVVNGKALLPFSGVATVPAGGSFTYDVADFHNNAITGSINEGGF